MDITTIIQLFELHIVIFILCSFAAIFSLVYLWHAIKPEIPVKTKILFCIASLILWLLTIALGWKITSTMVKVPYMIRSSPTQGDILPVESPDIKIIFNTPIVLGTLKVNSQPEIEFNIKKIGLSTILLSPKSTLPPGERYLIYLSNIEGPFTRGFGSELPLEYMTPETDVKEVTPAEGAKDISVEQVFTITTTTPINEKEWSVTIEPQIPVTLKKTKENIFTVTPNEPLRQNTRYRMDFIHTPILFNRKTTEEVSRLSSDTKMTIHFTTLSSAIISSFSPNESAVKPDTEITITFNEKMNTQTVIDHLSIEPAIDYKTTWKENDTILSLVHEDLTPDTEIKVKLSKGLTTDKGGSLENDITFSFRTAGPLKVVSTSPARDAKEISANTSIKITFDQLVPQSVTDHILISPNIPGKKTVTEKTVEIIPDTPLSQETRYSVTVTKGAKSDYGLPSAQDESFAFTTSQSQILMDVPFYRQQTLFTCNIAAARMLLAYRGTNITEATLINDIGLGGKRGSGNPYKGYIDDYGTYWDAINRGVSKYRPIRMITSGNLSDIIIELKKGNPVMTWGQNGWSDSHEISWTATDGTYIRAINGMHSAVVRGYSGPDDNPTRIFINDPWRGQYSMTKDEFMRRWSFFKIAMVVL